MLPETLQIWQKLRGIYNGYAPNVILLDFFQNSVVLNLKRELTMSKALTFCYRFHNYPFGEAGAANEPIILTPTSMIKWSCERPG